MDELQLKASSRVVLGKKVNSLRRQGITPAHVFGHDLESLALQCDASELQSILSEVGKAKLFKLKLDKERKTRNVVVREIQREPVTGAVLHVDLYQVRMEELLKVEIPIILVGEAPALRIKQNSMVQEMNNLQIECLPANIPANVEADISSLSEAGQVLRVKDLKLGEGVTVLNDPGQVIVTITSRRMEEEVVKVKEEVVAEGVVGAPEVAEAAEGEEAESTGKQKSAGKQKE